MWVRSIILHGVFVTIKRYLAAIPPEVWAAWAAAEAGGSDQVAASDAMDSLGAHHPPSTATGLTSARTTTATAPTSGATFS